MTAKEAAEYMRVSIAHLKTLGLGIRLSERRTVYRRGDLDAYMEHMKENGAPRRERATGPAHRVDKPEEAK